MSKARSEKYTSKDDVGPQWRPEHIREDWYVNNEERSTEFPTIVEANPSVVANAVHTKHIHCTRPPSKIQSVDRENAKTKSFATTEGF